MQLLTVRAEAYVHRGMWIVDCVRPDCANAEKLQPRQAVLHCSNCLLIADVVWPVNVDEVTEVLDRRPVPQTRNWAPPGHRQAVACGVPDGQTIQDLIDENREHGVD